MLLSISDNKFLSLFFNHLRPEPGFYLFHFSSYIYCSSSVWVVLWPFWPFCRAPIVPINWVTSAVLYSPLITCIYRSNTVSLIRWLIIGIAIVLLHNSRPFYQIVHVNITIWMDFKIVLKFTVWSLYALVWSLLMNTPLCLFISFDITFSLPSPIHKVAIILGGLEFIRLSDSLHSAFWTLTSLNFNVPENNFDDCICHHFISLLGHASQCYSQIYVIYIWNNLTNFFYSVL